MRRHRMSPEELRENFICRDCDKDTFKSKVDYYAVTRKVWTRFGVGQGMLCIGCLEKRMERPLQKGDIKRVPLNYENCYTSRILSK